MRRIQFPDDCLRLQKRILELGYEASLVEVQDFWEWRSSDFEASWLCFEEKDLYFQPKPPWSSFEEYLEKYLEQKNEGY